MQSHQFNSRHIMLKLALCCFFLAVFSAPAFSANMVTIFSQEYVKPVGKPVTYKDSFSVPSGVGTCTIVLKDEEGVRQAGLVYSVSVNGVTIFDSKELKGIKTDNPLLFPANNLLEVSLTGKGGNSLSIEIVGEVDNRDDDLVAPPLPF
jgi:hypothetical protein